jgi:hypothetical protein
MEKFDNYQFTGNTLSVRRNIQITALGVFVLCVSWIFLGVFSMPLVKAEWTNLDYLQWISKPSLSFVLTYINATLLTIIDVILFYFLYSYLNSFNKPFAQLGLIFIPIYGVLNIVCYSIQITTVPSIAKIAIESGNFDFAIQLIQAKTDTLIGYLNGLAYTMLGIPSIIYGYFMVKQTIKFSGIFLIASAILDFFGIAGYLIGNKTLAIGMILGGVAFTIALICMVFEFKKLKKRK